MLKRTVACLLALALLAGVVIMGGDFPYSGGQGHGSLALNEGLEYIGANNCISINTSAGYDTTT